MDPDPASSGQFLILLLQEPGILISPSALAVQIALLIFLFLASAFFSGSEVALFSLEASAVDSLDDSADSSSRHLRALLEQSHHVSLSILLLNTLVNVSAAILAAMLVADVATSLGWNLTWTVVVEMFVLSFLLLVVSEITPRLFASRNAPRVRRLVARPLLALHRMVSPLSRLLARTMTSVQQRVSSDRERGMSADDLRAVAEIGEARGTLEEEERDLIHSIVEFGETTVREVMVSRLDVVALPTSASLQEALETIRSSGHSRLPLYVEHLDNILGIVYAKDLLPYLSQIDDGKRVDWTRLARPPMFVPLGKKLDDLLKDFQSRKTHLAIVVDEYGGTAGLVTLEDLLEEIVGEIRDEHDLPEPLPYETVAPNVYRVDASLNLDDFLDDFDLDLDTDAFDFETLGGLFFHLTGEIPDEGDEATYGPLTLRVEEVENNRIKRVLVEVAPRPVEADGEAE